MWERMLALIFNYPSRCFVKLEDGELKEIVNPCSELKYFSDHFGVYSLSKTMIGKVTSDKADIDIANHLLKAIHTKIKDPFHADAATAEVLCKVIAYRPLAEGDVLNVPIPNDEGEMELVAYSADAPLPLWKKVCAFGLRAKGYPPLLLFRGTEFTVRSEGGRASILSDLDPKGPGHALFIHSRPQIQEWLEKATREGHMARVFGHSLGGALASYTAIYEFSYISTNKLHTSYAFNPPGVDSGLLATWELIPEKKRPEFVTYVTRGDLISKFGELFGAVYELSSPNALSPVIAHETLLFSQPVCYIHRVDTHEENKSESRLYYSNLQKKTTSFAYQFGLKHLLPNPYE